MLIRETSITKIDEDYSTVLLDLGKKAKNVLNYQVLFESQTRERRQRDNLKLLLKAGFRPFTEESVRTYKEMKLGWLNRYRWRMRDLVVYAELIPEFALQTAIKVKTAFPNSMLCIDSLVKFSTSDYGDPFLVVALNPYVNEFFYLEAWNEPGFNAVRILAENEDEEIQLVEGE